MHILVFAIAVALLLCQIDLCSTADSIKTLHDEKEQQEADSRALQTLQGLMDYYWNQDTRNKDIKFFFSCGQIGGTNGIGWKKCRCINEESCIQCYRWWDAVSVESIATYGLYADTTNNSYVPDIVFNHSPYNGNWDGVNYFTFVDDFAWFGIAYLRVFDWLKVCS